MTARRGHPLLRVIGATWFVLILALPMAAIAVKAFSNGPAALVAALTTPAALASLWLTLWTAALMALVTAVMGTLTAYVLVRYEFPGRSLLSAIVDLPLAMPTLVTGLMLVILLGPQSTLGAALLRHGVRLMFAWPAIVIALLFISFPMVVRSVMPVLLELDRDQEEAALTLGASRLTTFRRVVLPALWPSIVTGTLLAFARALGEFGSIVIVSGNIPRKTLTSSVFVFAEMESGHPESAAAMSLLLLVISFAIIALVRPPQLGAGEPSASARGSRPLDRLTRRERMWRQVVTAIVILYVCALVVAPSLAVLRGAFGRGVAVFVQKLAEPDALRSIVLTIVLAAVAVVVNGILGVAVAYVLVRDTFPGRRWLAGLVDLPSAVSPVIAGYMIILLFGRGGWFGPLLARLGVRVVFALPAMVLATIFVTVPFVIRSVMPVLEQAGLEQEQAAQTLGASGWQTFFRVTLPNIRWGLLYGITLTAARALGEFGAVLVVAGGLLGVTETATLYIFRVLDERNETGAYAIAVVLGVISVILLGRIEALRKRLQA